MSQTVYQISASQANSIFKIVCDQNGNGFRVKGPSESMTYAGIQTALAAFVGIRMHAAEVNARLNDYSEYGSDRREYLPRYRELESNYSNQYSAQPLVVELLNCAISPDQRIENLFRQYA